jgi:hypothetical protein
LFSEGKIVISEIHKYNENSDFQLTYQEFYDEEEAANIAPKHAYMLRDDYEDQVKLYDTSGKREIFVTITQISKYFNSLVVASI